MPKTVTVRLSTDEAARVTTAFRPHHLTRTTRGVRVHVDRIVRDLYNGSPAALLSAWSQRAGRDGPDAKNAGEHDRLELVRELQARPTTAWRDSLLDDLAKGKGWVLTTLRSRGSDAARTEAEQFLDALDHVPVSDPSRLRTFSSRVLRDSKAMDPDTELYARVADYLRSRQPVLDGDVAEQRRQAFERVNVFQNLTNVTVLVHGPLHLRYGDEKDDRVARNAARGLPTVLTLAELKTARVSPPLPSWVLTIENETPFNEAIESPGEREGLLVFTGGRFNRAVRILLSDAHLGRAPLWHWGDTDPDGFLILDQVREAHPASAVMMDAAAIQANRARLKAFKAGDQKRFETAASWRTGWIREALDACLRLGGFLEQETVPVEQVLATIRAHAGGFSP